MPSPWARRSLAEGQKLNRRAVVSTDYTLNNRVPADRHPQPREEFDRELDDIREDVQWRKRA